MATERMRMSEVTRGNRKSEIRKGPKIDSWGAPIFGERRRQRGLWVVRM